MLLPLVMATQSSWLMTTLRCITMLLEELTSKPSELCAAARPWLTPLGA